MRRLFLILLLAILPFQFAWAAAAGYCQHESGSVAVHHFGHHEHVHKDGSDSGNGAKGSLHTDCGVCHATALQAVLAGAQAMPGSNTSAADTRVTPPPPLSAPSSLPERPQWRRLA